jgi:small-conductance mechanosensitive channel
MRAWTMSHDQWQVVKSDLAVGVWKALKEANIEVPFPQRDLHLKSLNEEELKSIVQPRINSKKDSK